MIGEKLFLGTQGWNYPDWFGPFYPVKTPKSDLLSLYSKIFDSIEVDSTFYAVPSESTLSGWNARTPNHFRFSLKLPSEITHKNRLSNCQNLLEHFVERVRLLGEKLGCILIQLPPDFSPVERQALKEFVLHLPAGVHFAVEFRDANWISTETVETLNLANVSIALTDSKWIPRRKLDELLTLQHLPFSYIRWIGVRELTYFGKIQLNRDQEFAYWQRVIENLAQNNERIFAYFNNHYQGHSPGSVNQLKSRLGLPVTSPETLNPQRSLF